jgi:hypothetical protein
MMLFRVGAVVEFESLEVLTYVIRVYDTLKVCHSSYAPFTFIIALCGLLERTEPFIWPINFLLLVLLFERLFFIFRSIVEECTPFRYFDHLFLPV